MSNKLLGQQKFCVKKTFLFKEILSQKDFWVRKIMSLTKFWAPTNFRSEKYLVKKILGPKNSAAQKCVRPKLIGTQAYQGKPVFLCTM